MVVALAEPVPGHTALHLAELNRGERAVVTGVAQGEAHCQLCSLGLNAGAEVELVRTLSARTLLIVRVDGSDVALRQETASTVKIRRDALHAESNG